MAGITAELLQETRGVLTLLVVLTRLTATNFLSCMW
jgi:hypothetical protein